MDRAGLPERRRLPDDRGRHEYGRGRRGLARSRHRSRHPVTAGKCGRSATTATPSPALRNSARPAPGCCSWHGRRRPRMRPDKDLRKPSRWLCKGTAPPIRSFPAASRAHRRVPARRQGQTRRSPGRTGSTSPSATTRPCPTAKTSPTQIRTRLEDTGGMSVRLGPATRTPIRRICGLDRKAWTSTALAWLQPYLDAPLPAVDSTVSSSRTNFRGDAPTGGRPRPVCWPCCRSKRRSI